MAKQLQMILLLYCGLSAIGCTNQFKFSSGSSNSSETNAKAGGGGEGSRPSEEGEGVVGYLVDPASVQRQDNSDTIVLTAGDGVVHVDKGTPSGLTVCMTSLDKSQLYQAVNGTKALANVVAILATAKTTARGGFTLSTPKTQLKQGYLLGVDVSGRCAPGVSGGLGEVSQGGVSVAFADPAANRGFAKAQTIYPTANADTTAAGGGGTLSTPLYPSAVLCPGANPKCTLIVTVAMDKIVPEGVNGSTMIGHLYAADACSFADTVSGNGTITSSIADDWTKCRAQELAAVTFVGDAHLNLVNGRYNFEVDTADGTRRLTSLIIDEQTKSPTSIPAPVIVN